MTIPMLTMIQSEPARSPAAAPVSSHPEAHRETGRHRSDERDFATTLSDRAQDAPTERARGADTQDATEPARLPDKDKKCADTNGPQSGRDGASGEVTHGLAAPDAPRRQVTIPELPAKRGADAAPGVQSSEPIRGAQTAAAANAATVQPLAANPEITARATREATAETVSDATTSARAAPATIAVPGANRAEATPAAGTLVLPDASKAPSGMEKRTTLRPQAAGEVAQDDQRRGTTPPDARAAAAGNPIAQAVRANPLARGAPEPQAEDRMAGRTRDPVARAMEAMAATPAPAPQATAAQALVSAQVAVLQPASRDAATAKDKADTLLSLDGESEGLRFDLRGTSGSTSTQQGSFASALNQTQLPRGLAMQLGDIVRAMPDRPVEVALSPEELGRVRLSISTSEGGVTLNVLAERPETLDLMRRHAEQLARELADLGFGAIDLSFGQGRDPDSGDDDESGAANGRNARAGDDTDTAIPATGPVNRMTLSPSGGLDIRI